MNVLIVVDMQNDFVTGPLGTPEARTILPKVAEKVKNFPGRVLFTRDTHEENYLESREGKALPVPHCIRGTRGWEICPELETLRKEEPVDKPTFGSTGLGEVLRAADQYGEKIGKITLVGVCTDICVISNAMLLRAFFPEAPIEILSSCCAGVTPASHATALAALAACQCRVL